MGDATGAKYATCVFVMDKPIEHDEKVSSFVLIHYHKLAYIH